MKKTFIFLIVMSLVTAIDAAEERITLADGTEIDIFVEYPEKMDPAPRLALMLPGGPGNRQSAVGATNTWFKPLRERGWVTVVPISNDGKSFFGKHTKTALAIADVLQKRPNISNEKMLIGGCSNGGISAIAIASQDPKRFIGAMAIPGLQHRSTNTNKLRGLRVYLRIGKKDSLRWGQYYNSTVSLFKRYGAVLDAKLLPNAGHGIPLNWKEIDTWIKEGMTAVH